MAKKHFIISQVCLAALVILTLGYASNHIPAFACGESDGEATNCLEESQPMLISSDESKEKNNYAEAGANVNSNRTVYHSLFLAGNEVEAGDTVDGVDFVAGNLVTFHGMVEYGAFAGNSVKVNGDIKKDLFVAGNAVEINDSAKIGRDVFAGASALLIKTNLNGNAFLGGGRLVLEDITINGDVNADFDEIIIKGKVSIVGTFKYNEGAQISGLENVSAKNIETIAGSSSKAEKNWLLTLENKVLFLIGRIIVTVIFIAILPRFSKKLVKDICLRSSWKQLALGLGLLLLTPLVAIFMIATFIGIPLGALALAFYFIFAYFSTTVTGGVLGEVLAKNLFKREKMHIVAKYSIGIIAIVLLGLIPIVGGLINAVSTCFGFGYLVAMLFKKDTKAVQK